MVCAEVQEYSTAPLVAVATYLTAAAEGKLSRFQETYIFPSDPEATTPVGVAGLPIDVTVMNCGVSPEAFLATTSRLVSTPFVKPAITQTHVAGMSMISFALQSTGTFEPFLTTYFATGV